MKNKVKEIENSSRKKSQSVTGVNISLSIFWHLLLFYEIHMRRSGVSYLYMDVNVFGGDGDPEKDEVAIHSFNTGTIDN